MQYAAMGPFTSHVTYPDPERYILVARRVPGAIVLGIVAVTVTGLFVRAGGGQMLTELPESIVAAPASPAPKRKRAVTNDQKPVTMPLNAVNADHQITIRVITRRGPRRSPSAPVGISKIA